MLAGHRNRRYGKGIEPPDRQAAQNRPAARPDSKRKRPAEKSRGVEDDEAGCALGMSNRPAQADRAAPIVHSQRDGIKLQVIDELLEVVDVGPERVGKTTRLVGETTAHVIRGYDPIAVGKALDQFAVVERPRRVAVQQQDDRSLPLVDVVHSGLTCRLRPIWRTKREVAMFERIEVTKLRRQQRHERSRKEVPSEESLVTNEERGVFRPPLH